MSEDDEIWHVVRNNQRQPVELHLPSGVMVLLPGQTAQVPDAEIATPQLEALRRARAISTSRAAAPPPSTAPPSRDETTDSTDEATTAETSSDAGHRARRRGTTRSRT